MRTNYSLAAFVLLLSINSAAPSVATEVEKWGFVKANVCWLVSTGATAIFGAVLLGLGGMMTKFSLDDDIKIASGYNASAMTVVNYTVAGEDCRVCSGRSCAYYGFTGHTIDTYRVPTGNTTQTIYTSAHQTCGSTADDALMKVEAVYPLRAETQIYYEKANVTAWGFRIPSSPFWVGAVILYTVGGVVFLIGATLGGSIIFCR